MKKSQLIKALDKLPATKKVMVCIDGEYCTVDISSVGYAWVANDLEYDYESYKDSLDELPPGAELVAIIRPEI